MSLDSIDTKSVPNPNFPRTVEEVEQILKLSPLSLAEGDACEDDAITAQDRFLSEDLKLIQDIVDVAAVRLMIHRNAYQSEGGKEIMHPYIDANMSSVSTGWNYLYNNRFAREYSQYIDNLNYRREQRVHIKQGGSDFPVWNNNNFSIYIFLQRLKMQGWDDYNRASSINNCEKPNREFIALRAVTGDLENANFGNLVEGGDQHERAYILIHITDRGRGGYKFDGRTGHLELSTVIPESMAKRLDEAIRRNKKMRIRLIRELMHGAFPFLKGKEGEEYGALRFNQDFTYVGPDVKLRSIERPEKSRPAPQAAAAGDRSSRDDGADLIEILQSRNRIHALSQGVLAGLTLVGILLAGGIIMQECDSHDAAETTKP